MTRAAGRICVAEGLQLSIETSLNPLVFHEKGNLIRVTSCNATVLQLHKARCIARSLHPRASSPSMIGTKLFHLRSLVLLSEPEMEAAVNRATLSSSSGPN